MMEVTSLTVSHTDKMEVTSLTVSHTDKMAQLQVFSNEHYEKWQFLNATLIIN